MSYFVLAGLVCLRIISQIGLCDQLESKDYILDGKAFYSDNEVYDQAYSVSESPLPENAACSCKNGYCEKEDGKEICKCPDDFGYYAKNFCKACACGPGSSCTFQGIWTTTVSCICKEGYHENNGKCVECNCGRYGKCSFENGKKKCDCGLFAVEINGICEYLSTSVSTSVSTYEWSTYSPTIARSTYSPTTERPTYSPTTKRSTYSPTTIRACSCGEKSISCRYDWKGDKKCRCFPAYADNNGYCEECNCGPYGSCRFEYGEKKCYCISFAFEMDGVCVVTRSTTEGTTDSSTTSASSSTTAPACSCGVNSISCRYDWKGDKKCKCFPGYADNNGYCEECNCGPYGSCRYEYGRKKCYCISFAFEMDGVCVAMGSTTKSTTDSYTTSSIPSSTAQACSCGVNSISCRYDWRGDKKCKCFPGYADNNGYCEECNCGPYGSCRYEYGRKKCYCISFAFEIDGVCVAVGTFTEATTDSGTISNSASTTVQDRGWRTRGTSDYASVSTTDSPEWSTYSSSTVQDCDCGPRGRCTFEFGRKKCVCDAFTSVKYGICEDCNCGENSKSCHFNWIGDKVCNCTSGYAQVQGVCFECDCGVNSESCSYKKNGAKVCNCDFGYIQANGYCSAICSEDKCLHGKCEIIGNTFSCRCNEGFTGQRCEEKIPTKSNKQNLWMILLLSVTFGIFLLLTVMFSLWTRIMNKMTLK